MYIFFYYNRVLYQFLTQKITIQNYLQYLYILPTIITMKRYFVLNDIISIFF